MPDTSLHASLAASAVMLFASNPHWDWERGADRHRSRAAISVPIAVLLVLSAISTIVAMEYPLSLIDVLNQFSGPGSVLCGPLAQRPARKAT